MYWGDRTSSEHGQTHQSKENLAAILSDNGKVIHQANSMSIDQLNTDYGILTN